MQERTRSQMLEDLVANLQNHAETGQIPKPYRRGSWRPIGHMRPSSPLLDSVRDMFEGQDQLAKDFTKAFMLTYTKNGNSTVSNFFLQKRAFCHIYCTFFHLQDITVNSEHLAHLFDITFNVGQGKTKTKLLGIRAILGVRSRYYCNF